MRRALDIFARVAVRLGVLALLLWGGWWLLMDPRSPLPPEWHPVKPLDVAAPTTWLTGTKLRRALASDRTCLAALKTGATFERLEPLVEGPQCGIDPRVALRTLGPARLDPVETTCATALRAAMWTRHSLVPAARALGSDLAAIRHQGSYSCRTIRGSSTRMSTHATAAALDVRGIALADGRQLELLTGWDDPGPEGVFWRNARAGACRWFVTVLGPEFNALHADHFHLQSRGWGLCR